jgi:hypothetical protein
VPRQCRRQFSFADLHRAKVTRHRRRCNVRRNAIPLKAFAPTTSSSEHRYTQPIIFPDGKVCGAECISAVFAPTSVARHSPSRNSPPSQPHCSSIRSRASQYGHGTAGARLRAVKVGKLPRFRPGERRGFSENLHGGTRKLKCRSNGSSTAGSRRREEGQEVARVIIRLFAVIRRPRNSKHRIVTLGFQIRDQEV